MLSSRGRGGYRYYQKPMGRQDQGACVSEQGRCFSRCSLGAVLVGTIASLTSALRDEYFRMKLQWKSVSAEQERRNSLLHGYRSLIGGWVGEGGADWKQLGGCCGHGAELQWRRQDTERGLGALSTLTGRLCDFTPLCLSESHTGGGNERFWGTPTLTVA